MTALKTFTVQEAKTRLSALLRKARAGQLVRIGAATGAEACVLVPESAWRAALNTPTHSGQWLLEHRPSAELRMPPRTEKRPDNPFKR